MSSWLASQLAQVGLTNPRILDDSIFDAIQLVALFHHYTVDLPKRIGRHPVARRLEDLFCIFDERREELGVAPGRRFGNDAIEGGREAFRLHDALTAPSRA